MTEAEWDGAANWYAMLTAVPHIDRSRKLRLWCVAWARLVLAEAATDDDRERLALEAAPPEEYAREVDAAEAFADGTISRREMGARRARSGGPYNALRFSTALTTLIASDAAWAQQNFVNEFGVPPGEHLAALVRCIFGNPFRPVSFDPAWRTSTAVAVARQMYDARDFGAMPILADALQDAGCEDEQVLTHCRSAGPHARGCWVCDAVLYL
jgi:hypothetical protein